MNAERMLLLAQMQIVKLKEELEGFKKAHEELLFCEGRFVQADNHSEVSRSRHFRKAMSELTRRQAYSKGECATLIAEQAFAREKAEAKAAAFDWLMARLQEAYDQSGSVEVGDISISAQTVWGHREECLMKAEIQWTDKRDEPLNLLAALEKAIYEHRAP